ncbi:hypothetical protein CIPAW_09G131600 [Carya illinoinensis]|uniref:Uncharacterized protein n=1 Tax=Carya illinoinensis TaxID=32201 RepID=A0A8T1PCC8_CARIL|nr:hypothetical protein CIPAW_09G131600 [Carya illinoinensis]
MVAVRLGLHKTVPRFFVTSIKLYSEIQVKVPFFSISRLSLLIRSVTAALLPSSLTINLLFNKQTDAFFSGDEIIQQHNKLSHEIEEDGSLRWEVTLLQGHEVSE